MPPRYLLEKVAVQAQEIADDKSEASPFAKPLATFPSNVAAADEQRLRSAVLEAINAEVLPAYKRFGTFVRDEYAPHGRSDPGIWRLPDGVERYRFEIRRMTTTDLTPEQIHQIGLKQVAETEAEMLVDSFFFNVMGQDDATGKLKLGGIDGDQLDLGWEQPVAQQQLWADIENLLDGDLIGLDDVVEDERQSTRIHDRDPRPPAGADIDQAKRRHGSQRLANNCARDAKLGR